MSPRVGRTTGRQHSARLAALLSNDPFRGWWRPRATCEVDTGPPGRSLASAGTVTVRRPVAPGRVGHGQPGDARPPVERTHDDVDRDLIALRRTQHHQLGFAMQMGTVRYVGRFLVDDPLDVPWSVVEHLVAQLGIEDETAKEWARGAGASGRMLGVWPGEPPGAVLRRRRAAGEKASPMSVSQDKVPSQDPAHKDP